jgi:hypothetical protein
MIAAAAIGAAALPVITDRYGGIVRLQSERDSCTCRVHRPRVDLPDGRHTPAAGLHLDADWIAFTQRRAAEQARFETVRRQRGRAHAVELQRAAT